MGHVVISGEALRRLREGGPGIDDTLVGEIAVAREPIAPGGLGRGELRGSTFTLRNADAESLSVGQRCRVHGGALVAATEVAGGWPLRTGLVLAFMVPALAALAAVAISRRLS